MLSEPPNALRAAGNFEERVPASADRTPANRDHDSVLYVHAGTHKTATTYIQDFLNANREVLFSQGLYVPVAGQVTSVSGKGHHNIAFQLNSDPRFDSRCGTVADLLAELESVRAPKACLSSEDFEYLCMNTDALRTFVAQCNESNYTVKFVIFLRPQADYSESLYSELVHWGFSSSFDEFVRNFIADGAVRHRSNWWYCSDYNILLDNLASVVGTENLIVYPYKSSSVVDRIIADFLSRVLPTVRYRRGHYQIANARKNRSASFPDVVRAFVENRTSTSPIMSTFDRALPDEMDIDCWQGPFEPIDFRCLLQFFKFFPANLKVWRKFGTFVPVASAKLFWRVLQTYFRRNNNREAKRQLLRDLPQTGLLPRSLDVHRKFSDAPHVWKAGEGVLSCATMVNCSLQGDVLTAINGDPQIIFPIEWFGVGKNRYLQLDLIVEQWDESNTDITAQVFWTTESSPFSERNSHSLKLKSGERRKTFIIPPEAEGLLRLDPVNMAGTYTLKSLELRSD